MKDKEIEIADTSLAEAEKRMTQMSRNQYVRTINDTMENLSRLDSYLKHMEDVITDPEVFSRLSARDKLAVYANVSRRHKELLSQINSVFGTAIRTDFNRNFFGIRLGDLVEDTEEDKTPELSKGVRMLLSQINNRMKVTARSSEVTFNLGEEEPKSKCIDIEEMKEGG